MKTLRSIAFAGSLAILGLTGCATTETSGYRGGESGPLTKEEMQETRGNLPAGYTGREDLLKEAARNSMFYNNSSGNATRQIQRTLPVVQQYKK